MIRWQGKFTRVALAAALLVGLGGPAFAKNDGSNKLDPILKERAGTSGTSRVIVILRRGADVSTHLRRLGGRPGRRLGLISGQVVELPNAMLRRLAERSEILSIHYDRPTAGELNRAAVTVGARDVQLNMGYNGAGVGVAVIDSGISAYHDDLTYDGTSSQVLTYAGQRTVAFVDFVNGRTTRYDDNGHGTHVAGIIAGNGTDSRGARAGIAPAAHLVGLKVLDDHGRGVISNVIAAVEWAVRNKRAYNIRVVNMSVGAAVTESYRTDPLTVAARRAVDAGLVVVTAAGNLGKNALGQVQYGGITSPGNAPWVLTVGASSHEGTVTRADDVMALYSSRGPTAIDFGAKPDVVAPGTGIVSLAEPGSLMYVTKAAYLLSGTLLSTSKPYLSLSGTSMASPVVAGTVALMLQANPSLTPNMVKAIIQYTAQKYAGYDALTQGAGFLNTRGAVVLARFFRTARSGSRLAIPASWSRQILWGNRRITGGVIRPNANAYELGVTWGAARDLDGDNIVWGTLLAPDADNIVWGTFDTLDSENIVWGTLVDDLGENIVWGTRTQDDDIVWGTAVDVENIVWGTDCAGADCEDVVWGTSIAGLDDDIVWGTAEAAENIVWGTSGDIDDIVWGTSSDDDSMTWGSSGDDTPLFDDPDDAPMSFDETVWDSLFIAEPVQAAPATEETTVIESTSTTGTTPVSGVLGGGL